MTARSFSGAGSSPAPEVAPAVSVIVPARDAEGTLGRTLDALAAQDLGEQFEVIVVDDGSIDRTATVGRDHRLGATLVTHDTPGGAGNARNRGAQAARAPVLAFTDADCFPTPEWLSCGLAAIRHHDVLQGAVRPDPGAKRGPFDRTLVVAGESGYYQTANLFVRRELFDELGGFEDWIVERPCPGFARGSGSDEGRPTPTRQPIGEDVLFGWEARRSGARTGFAPDVIVDHAVFPSTPMQAIRSRWHWRHLPALASRIPEMRDHSFYRRWFFYRRSAAFDCAVAAALLAIMLRRPAPLIAGLPYVEYLRRDAVAWRDHGIASVVATRIGTDAMSLAALAAGSVRWRAPLL